MTIKEKVKREIGDIRRDYYTKRLRGVESAADQIMKACYGEDYWRIAKFVDKKERIEDCIRENLSGDYYSGNVKGDKEGVAGMIMNILEK